MGLFKPATNTQAFLKCGILGFAGAGKTYTATEIAIGLQKQLLAAKAVKPDTPIFFLDTETGSDWMQKRLTAAGIPLVTAKTRAFKDLIPAVREAEKQRAVLIIDSITHFWREITESYAAEKRRTQGLQFQDWAWLKKKWGEYTDAFVNSNCHIIMCGRAGYEYDYFENEGGKKELQKTGIKMRAETETGYEPSLLVLMEREVDLDTKEVTRVAYVLKDRSDLLDGKSFKNPTFKNFLPHIEFLNIGGDQLGVDTSRTSAEIVEKDNREWKYEQEQKTIVLDEIETLLVEHFPSQKAEDKAAKLKALRDQFDTGSWERIKTFSLDVLKNGFVAMQARLEGVPAQEPPTEEVAAHEPLSLADDSIPEFPGVESTGDEPKATNGAIAQLGAYQIQGTESEWLSFPISAIAEEIGPVKLAQLGLKGPGLTETDREKLAELAHALS